MTHNKRGNFESIDETHLQDTRNAAFTNINSDTKLKVQQERKRKEAAKRESCL